MLKVFLTIQVCQSLSYDVVGLRGIGDDLFGYCSNLLTTWHVNISAVVWQR